MPAGVGPGPGPPPIDLTSSFFPSTRLNQEFTENHQELSLHENPNPILAPNLPVPFHPTSSPHISATALLQKAAQMGATMSSSSNKTGSAANPMLSRPHQGHHVSADSGNNNITTGFGLNLSSREEFVNGLVSYGNKAAGSANAGTVGGPPPPSLLQDMMMSSLSSSAATGFEGSTFEDALGGIFSPRKNDNFHQILSKASNEGGGGGNDGMTRDFLGLRPLSHSDIFNIAGLGNCMNTASSEHHQNTSQKSWQG